jgi:hypothetical protein
MRIRNKEEWTFGELIQAAYEIWRAGQGKIIARLTRQTRLVVVPARFNSLISFPKAKHHE